MQVKLFDMKANEVGALELNDQLFNIEYNEAVIHQAIVTRLANERQGTKSTLTRSEVRGGGKKPYRQKGTGQRGQQTQRRKDPYGSERCGLFRSLPAADWSAAGI